jgi:cytosine/uracil/thiamine/allantoin permease
MEKLSRELIGFLNIMEYGLLMAPTKGIVVIQHFKKDIMKKEVVIDSVWTLKNGYHVQVISINDTTIVTRVISGKTLREYSHENFHKKHNSLNKKRLYTINTRDN